MGMYGGKSVCGKRGVDEYIKLVCYPRGQRALPPTPGLCPLPQRREGFAPYPTSRVKSEGLFEACSTPAGLTLAATSAPAPITTITCSYNLTLARTLIFAHVPRYSSVTFSSFTPRSSETTCPPVITARSCNMALRLSPNPDRP